MAALLKDALAPNLVQTLENNPAFIHGGPFANIAHGCNSVMATKTALKLADYVVTEGGFGADLGAEKFVDIKCRKAGLKPDAAVIVATVRAIKYHGGVDVPDLGKENLKALQAGIANLDRHIDNVRDVFGLPCLVAINHRAEDSEAELNWLQERATHHGVKVIVAKHYAEGGKGAVEVANEVVELCEHTNYFKFVYDDKDTLWDKMKAVATKIYGASEITADSKVRGQIKQLQDVRLRPLPDLRGEDPVLLLDGSEAARRAARARRERPRSAARSRRGVRRDDLRRHHDDARPAGRPGGECHRRHRRRQDHGPVLGAGQLVDPGLAEGCCLCRPEFVRIEAILQPETVEQGREPDGREARVEAKASGFFREIAEQRAEQVAVAAPLLVVHRAHFGRDLEQSPEHDPGGQHLRVEVGPREHGLEEGAKPRARLGSGGGDRCLETLGQLAAERAVALRDQRVFVREMVIDQADRNAGLGRDAPHRQAFVPVALEAVDRGFNQGIAPVARDLAFVARLRRARAHCGRLARFVLQPLAGGSPSRHSGNSARMRRPKLRRHTSPSPSGPTV